MQNSRQSFRWGILGAGHIAKKLVKSSWSVDGCTVVAAASETPGKVDDFVKEWEIEKAYSSYEELVKDQDIDIVYVANLHNLHFDAVMMALDAGKHVLCEKPLAVNANQARQMVQAAREKNLFLMEAMWTRFLPSIAQARDWLAEGLVGTVKQVHASFGINLLSIERIVRPEMAGGALLDLGIYPLSFASMVSGGDKPKVIQSCVDLLDTGVDGSAMIQLQYQNDIWADLKCSCAYRLPTEAWIIGDKGRIHLPADFYASQTVVLCTDEETRKEVFPSERQQSFKYQIKEVQDCIKRGESESRIMPLDETIILSETMDTLREKWGVKYPGE